MLPGLMRRLLTEPDKRVLTKFVVNFGWKGMRAVQRFKRRTQRGENFPAFLFISITNECNLSCQGCWVTPTTPPARLSPDTIDRLIEAGRRNGSYFFGILGGEPLLYPGLLDVLARHPDCYFQVFTNGTALTDGIAATLRKLGNVTPLVSVEGLERASDERRGGHGVYARAMEGLDRCRKHRLIAGVATSVCRSNFDDVVSEAFVRDLVRRGVLYVWYYIYRPSGPHPCPDLALDEAQILALRKFVVDVRGRQPIIVVDAYWDHEGRALCPAAVGISHHVNPSGDLEPCPPIQFARDNVSDGGDAHAVIGNSEFLRAFRRMSAQSRGCVLLKQPAALATFFRREQARDVTGRGRGYAELEAMQPHPDHHLEGREIPETHWLYRWAKKHWFFGFGAYG